MTTDISNFSSGTMEGRKKWNSIFKVLKEEYINPELFIE